MGKKSNENMKEKKDEKNRVMSKKEDGCMQG